MSKVNGVNHDWLPKGSQHWNSKLTEDDVRLILALNEERLRLREELSRVTTTAMAEKFGVATSVICRICAGHDWRHV
jgi:hypothetical protein